MLQVSNLAKSFGPQEIFSDVTFSINPGERIGVVGRNGHGKSTLLRIIAGREHADNGDIHASPDYRIGFLEQHLRFQEATVLKEASLGLRKLEGGWQETYRAETILQGLGFSDEDLAKPPTALSGGFQVRLNLAKLLASDPNLLLLDEPTNYLDIVSMRWLDGFLKNWPHELMLITHGRDFMDSVCTHTLGIHRGKVRKVGGGTEKYYAQLALEEEVYEQSRVNQEKKVRETEEFIRRFRAKASKARAVQSRVKKLERMQTLEQLAEIDELDFNFNHQPFAGKWLMHVNGLAFRYANQSEYLFSGLSFSVGSRDRIGVIGRNGKGKSSLLAVLAGVHRPVEGEVTRSSGLSLGYFGQTNVERLNPECTVEEELLEVTPNFNRTKARSVAGLMMFEGEAALKKVKVLSGGEKSRVLLGRILLSPANLLLLDEPNNHLDMESTESLLEAVESFPGAVIIVTHSEQILRGVASRLIVFDQGRAEMFEGGYDDFLSRIGWSEEEGERPQKAAGSQLNKKELRRRRAEVIQQKSKVVGSLQKQVDELESEIQRLEVEVGQDTEKLIEISQDGFGEEAAKLSRSLHQKKSRLEACYEQLEPLLTELEEKGRVFEQQLAELGTGSSD